MNIRTAIVIGNIPYNPKLKKPTDLFSNEEIDQLDSGMLAGLSQEELLELKQKLLDSFTWLESGDWKMGDPRWDEWNKRLKRLSDMMDSIDDILNPDTFDEDEGWD